MSYLGLFALGVFVGSLLCIAIRQNTNWSDPVKVVVALLGAALSGVVFSFIQYLVGDKLQNAIYMYPIGLAWSLIWLYADQVIVNLSSADRNKKLVGFLHLGAMVISTVLAFLLLFAKWFRDLLPT